MHYPTLTSQQLADLRGVKARVMELGRQFKPKMNWDNYGEWQIDHVVPISQAKTTNKIIELNHFTNLRPMWAIDNIKKSNKSEYLI